MKNRLLILSFLFSIQFNAYSNRLLDDTIVVLKVKEVKLLNVLDSIIFFEKKCKYYNKKLIFDINIQSIQNYTSIQIESFGHNRLYERNHIGCFKYNGNLFFVSGDLIDSLFFRTKKQYRFKKQKTENKNTVYLNEEGMYLSALFKYSNNQIILIGRSTPCR